MVVDGGTVCDSRCRRLIASRTRSCRVVSSRRVGSLLSVSSVVRSCTHVERGLPTMRMCLIVLLLLLQGCRQLVTAEAIELSRDDDMHDVYREVLRDLLQSHVRGSLALDPRNADVNSLGAGLQLDNDGQMTGDTRREVGLPMSVKQLVREAGRCLLNCKDSGDEFDTCKRLCVPEDMISLLKQLLHNDYLSNDNNVLRKRQNKRGAVACIQRCLQRGGLEGHRCKTMCH